LREDSTINVVFTKLLFGTTGVNLTSVDGQMPLIRIRMMDESAPVWMEFRPLTAELVKQL
jgi:hypothetical protein